MLARLRDRDPVVRRWLIGIAGALVVLAPLLLSGAGNDLDVANVFRSGRSIARHAGYVPSRPPGAPVHEALVGVLDLVGGPLAATLLSFGAAVALLWNLDRLLEEEGVGRTGRWALALLALNPWFVVAATSTVDGVLALAFVAASARALRHDRALAAGVLGALAMGCRVGSAALLVAAAVAEVSGRRREEDRPWRRVASAAGVAGIGTVLLYVPSAVSAGGLSFAENDFSTSSPLVQVGRAAAKDLLLLGLPSLLVLLVAVPTLVAALRSWSTSWIVRFAAIGLVLAQVVFIRFPWKMVHLLPTLLCLVLLLAVALEDRPRVVVAVAVLQLVFAVVRIDVVQPDEAGRASGARIDPGLTWGPVVQDWICRREHPNAHRGRQKHEVEPAYTCAAPFAE